MRRRVAVFEDQTKYFDRLRPGLERRLGKGAVDRYPGQLSFADIEKWVDRLKPNAQARLGNLLEEYLTRFLTKPRLAGMAVIDFDLGDYRHPLSFEGIRACCNRNGIPVCVYEASHGDVAKIKRLQRWQESELALDSFMPYSDIAKLCGHYFEGFAAISRTLRTSSKASLPVMIDRLLKTPASSRLHIGRYLSGSFDATLPRPVVVCLVGYWIRNHLMQFPGVLLDSVAAASFLNIPEAVLVSKRGLALLATAQYRGPFSAIGRYWWRHELDRLCADETVIADREIIGGNELFSRRLKKKVSPARCAHGHDGAGYVCIVSRKPVCATHSVPPQSWAPSGADRARIDLKIAREQGGWLSV